MRGHRDRNVGAQRPPGSYHDRAGQQKYGINAGVMVLKPSKEVFAQMQVKLKQENHPEHIATTMPEQDFLTRFFITEWRDLHVRYNYQIHQLQQGSEEDERMLSIRYEDVKILHFSTEQKPCDFLFKTGLADFSKFMHGFLTARPRRHPDHIQNEIDQRVKRSFQVRTHPSNKNANEKKDDSTLKKKINRG